MKQINDFSGLSQYFIYRKLKFLMSKARSYKNQPFAAFDKQSYSILKDDFVHEKLLTVKANIQSGNGGVNLKQTLAQKGDALTSTGETKLWFYFKNQRSIYTKILPQSLTVSYDHGVQEANGRSFNWFGGIETNRAINNNVWKLGVEVFDAAGKWSFNNLLQFGQSDRNLLWTQKGSFTHNNWFVNDFHTFDLTKKSCTGSSWLFAWRNKAEKNEDFTARFELNGWSSVDELKRSLTEGNKLTLNWVRSQKGKWAHGLEFSSNVNQLRLSASDIWRKITTAYEVPLTEQNATLKLRVSGNWTAALSMKHTLGSYGSYIWGAEISEIGSKNNIRFGVQVDLNL